MEDDLLVASQIEETLIEAGFEIAGPVTTGEEALELARTDTPDLVIADVRLAGARDGIDVALEFFRLYGVRTIFASAYSDHDARQRAEPGAPFGWLQKPYTMASLAAMVRMASQELRRQGT